ncbi:MAG: helix-turn-helix transcriptional regulator [Coriobacteriales bacterium]|jgi:DNA-binding CsgD family transcriptional regulator|nr:helix-turn-helix transcriptional regulator [Coriobacteriales bacterium]
MGNDRRTLLLVGMACFMTWINTASVAPDFSKNIDSLSIQPIHTFVLLATLMLVIVLRRRFDRILANPLFVYIVTAVALIGSVAMRSGYLFTELTPFVTLAGAVFSACANACFLVLWGECYALVDDRIGQARATFAAIPCSFVGIILVSVTPSTLSIFLVAALPIGSLICIRHILKTAGPVHPEAPHTEQRLKLSHHSDGKSLLRLLLFIVAFSLPLDYLNTLLGERVSALSRMDWSTTLAVSLLFFAAVVAGEHLCRKRNLTILPIGIALLMTAGLVFYFIFDSATLVITVPTTSGYSLFVAFFYCLLGFSVLRSKRAPFLVFALGNMANILGLVLGWLLGRLVELLLFPLASYIAIAIVYGVLLASFFLQPSKSNMFSEQDDTDKDRGHLLPSFIEETSKMVAIAGREFSLSTREQEILLYLMRGRRLDTIAHEISLSVNTVKTHVEHLYRKIDVHSHEELIIRVEQTAAHDDSSAR